MHPYAAAVESGPSWVTLLAAVGIGTVLSSFITGSFLVVQTRMTNARERDRLATEAEERARERRRDDALRQQARKDALDDHWREERQDAYTKLIAQLQAGLEHATWASRVPGWARGAGHPGGSATMTVGEREAVSTTFARVDIIGSADTRMWARVAMTRVLRFDAAVSRLPAEAMPDEDLARDAEEAESALRKYVECVRVDLGTGAWQ